LDEIAGRLIQFMGTHQTRFDAKGRMSVPAPFRAALRAGSEDGAMGLVLRPSHKHSCIEAWPASAFQNLAVSFDRLDIFSADQDDLTTALYADAWPVEPDKEGRISVPDSLVQHAGLTDSVVFMGLGRLFQIWEPQAASRRIASAREGVVQRGLTLPAARP
jgi:MraZ protein